MEGRDLMRDGDARQVMMNGREVVRVGDIFTDIILELLLIIFYFV